MCGAFGYMDKNIEYPDWQGDKGCNEWKSHVPQHVRERWDAYTPVTKRDLYDWAKLLAMEED